MEDIDRILLSRSAKIEVILTRDGPFEIEISAETFEVPRGKAKETKQN